MIEVSQTSRQPVHTLPSPANARPARLPQGYQLLPTRDLERLIGLAAGMLGVPYETRPLAVGATLLALMARSEPAIAERAALNWRMARGAPADLQVPLILGGAVQMVPLPTLQAVRVP